MSLIDNEEHNNVIVSLRVSEPGSIMITYVSVYYTSLHCASAVQCAMSLCKYNSKQPIKE